MRMWQISALGVRGDLRRARFDRGGAYPGLGAQSLQSLMGLFLQSQGQFGTFLYTDPTDNSATAAPTIADRRRRDHDFHASRARSAASPNRSDG